MEGIGEAPQRSICINVKGLIARDWDKWKGSLWLLANWHELQKWKLKALGFWIL